MGQLVSPHNPHSLHLECVLLFIPVAGSGHQGEQPWTQRMSLRLQGRPPGRPPGNLRTSPLPSILASLPSSASGL